MLNRREFLGSVSCCAIAAVVPLGAVGGASGGLLVWGVSPASAPLGAMITLADYAAKHFGDSNHAALVEDLTERNEILDMIPWRDAPA